MKNRYIALIPAYKPEDKLSEIIDGLKDKEFEIVVVDDGSGPDYAEIFEEAESRAVVLRHERNRGKGAALKTGLGYIYKYMTYNECRLSGGAAEAVSGKNAVIVTVDADGQHLPDDVLRVSKIAEMNRDAIVLGSRALAEDVPVRSKFGNTVTRHVYSAATGVHIHDTQTGLRAFRMSMIPRLLEIEGERYEYEINVLLRLAAEGVQIIEEEIETVYEDNNSKSHFNTVKDSIRIYKEILKFSASSLASFAIDYAMYAILLALTGAAGIAHSLIVSNIGARIVSGAANYTMNRHLVFRSRTGFAKSASQYIALAAFILAGNTVVLSMLVGSLGMGRMAAKIITEIIFFTISWTVQRYIIFYGSESGSDVRRAGGESLTEAAPTEGR